MLKGKEYRHFFIGGGIEEGETPEEAVMRELKECNNRSYFPDWYREVKRLVEDYTM